MREVENVQDLDALVGQEVGVSDWVTVDQERINQFAEATGDHQWIHVDVERAKKELPTENTIAHGFLTLSLIPMLSSQIMTVKNASRRINYGCNRIRFTNMVPTGSRVRARQKLKSVEPTKSGAVQVINEVAIEIEGQDRPACIAETIALIYP